MRLGVEAAAAAVFVTVVVVMATAGVTAAVGSFVDTEDGRVSGIVEASVKGRQLYSFYGIPFSQPPLGKLRFKVHSFTLPYSS